MAADPIKKITLASGKVRYRFVVDVGRNPETGERQQVTRTFDTKTEAKNERARILHERAAGTLVAYPDTAGSMTRPTLGRRRRQRRSWTWRNSAPSFATRRTVARTKTRYER